MKKKISNILFIICLLIIAAFAAISAAHFMSENNTQDSDKVTIQEYETESMDDGNQIESITVDGESVDEIGSGRAIRNRKENASTISGSSLEINSAD